MTAACPTGPTNWPMSASCDRSALPSSIAPPRTWRATCSGASCSPARTACSPVAASSRPRRIWAAHDPARTPPPGRSPSATPSCTAARARVRLLHVRQPPHAQSRVRARGDGGRGAHPGARAARRRGGDGARAGEPAHAHGLANGPGRLAQALGVDLRGQRPPLGRGPTRRVRCAGRPPTRDRYPRGASASRGGTRLELRFYVEGNAYVSGANRAPRPRSRDAEQKGGDAVKLKDIYRIAVETGDRRRRAGQATRSTACLRRAKEAYDKLDEDDKPFFDAEKLTNPYADTRICCGDPEARGPRAHRGRRHGGRRGPARRPAAREGRADRPRPSRTIPRAPATRGSTRSWACRPTSGRPRASGSAPATPSSRPRAEEIRRKIMPVNHYRAVQSRRARSGSRSMSCHTPADNSVNTLRAGVRRRASVPTPSTRS